MNASPFSAGTLKPDVTFLGFDLTDKEAIGDPGWFLVIQQAATEPCFGLMRRTSASTCRALQRGTI